MTWLRRRRRSFILGGLALLYVVALTFFIRANLGPVSDSRAEASGGAGASLGQEGTPTSSAAAESSVGPRPLVTDTEPAPGITITESGPGGLSLIGPIAHHVVLRVSVSQGRIMRLGYLVPTSPDHPLADMRNVQSPWTLRTTAYGKPGYAEIFLQTDKTGAPITCEITVDGKVTARKSTKGPYGQAVCIG